MFQFADHNPQSLRIDKAQEESKFSFKRIALTLNT